MKLLRWMYMKAVLNLLPMLAVIIALLIFWHHSGVGILILIFGGAFALGRASKSLDIFKSIGMLNTEVLVERAVIEEPTREHYGYAITHTFAWGFDRDVCIPLQEIVAVKPVLIQCVNNNAKSRAMLKVYTRNGSSLYLMYRGSSATERDYDSVRYCIRDLSRILPNLEIRS